MIAGLLLIFIPLILGYCLSLSNPKHLYIVNKATLLLIVGVLTLMGISLANLDNIMLNIRTIAVIVTIFSGSILVLNLIGLYYLSKKIVVNTVHSSTSHTNMFAMVFQSLKLIGYVVAGFVIGVLIPIPPSIVESASEGLLMLLLLLIGIELRNSGISLRQILLNKAGLAITCVIYITSWCGGIIAAYILSLPLSQGLAMASGFGWYTLSGILIGDLYGPVYGGAAFINELFRELLALILIPVLIRTKPLCAIGIGGATSMDFTLPVIQTHGGAQLVPIAIVSGFLLSLSVPVFTLLFSSLPF
ncbi:lysine exporter LysO family protein [Thaumasiovibrio sp. DFM-14]|uniref:lysine exporter LysO family protein n=1 Tax=Thaumasiovibrio sp. DFM-14 TaxID=3384792 RepID=UPI0039A0A432